MIKHSRIYKSGLLVVVFLVSAITLVLIEPIAQDLAYHQFSDCRKILGLPHFMDVLSNLPFLVVGYLGIRMVQKNFRNVQPTQFLMHFILFTGVFLTGAGSAFYHYNPNNFTLIFDRLPMVMVFTSLFAIIISDYVDRRFGAWVFYLFVVIGVYSVLYWYYTEIIRAGDLRMYAFVQFFPIITIPLILGFYNTESLYTKQLLIVFGLYIMAKVFEQYDKLVFELTGIVSGHTIKHLVSALALYFLYKIYKEYLVKQLFR